MDETIIQATALNVLILFWCAGNVLENIDTCKYISTYIIYTLVRVKKPSASKEKGVFLIFSANNWPSKVAIMWKFLKDDLLPPASEGWGKVMFLVCSHLGGGGTHIP